MDGLAVFVVIQTVHPKPEIQADTIVRSVHVRDLGITVDEHLHCLVVKEIERFVGIKTGSFSMPAIGEVFEEERQGLFVGKNGLIGLSFVALPDDARRTLIIGIIFQTHDANRYRTVGMIRIQLNLLPLVPHKIEFADLNMRGGIGIDESYADIFHVFFCGIPDEPRSITYGNSKQSPSLDSRSGNETICNG